MSRLKGKARVARRGAMIAMLMAGAAWCAPLSAQTAPPVAGQVALAADGAVTLGTAEIAARFEPSFTIMMSDADPRLGPSVTFEIPRKEWRTLAPENTPLPSWIVPGTGKRSDNMFDVARAVTVRASGATRVGGRIEWRFPASDDFTLEAWLEPAAKGGDPVIGFRFTPKRAGWYSIGYTGAPTADAAAVDDLWQPPIWQEKRFPRGPILSASNLTMVPATTVTSGGRTIGVTPDPAELPFAMPNRDNAGFGVMLRNPAGQAQPMLFAPVLGGKGSRMEAGQAYSFRLRPFVVKGGWYDAFRHLARDLYQVGDAHENLDISLNQTLDNMVDFAMNDRWSGWEQDLKGFNYDSDVPGTVKVVSALQPIAVALIRDDADIYRRRGLPMAEYLLSREKFLFTTDRSIKTQAPSANMNGPAAGLSELAALDELTMGRNYAFHRLANDAIDLNKTTNLDRPDPSRTFWNYLALYRINRDPKLLDEAKKLADAYIARRIDTPQTDMRDAGVSAQFWSDWGPHWIELLQLWEETKEPRYLAAAHRGAERYASYTWIWPVAPKGAVTVDKGGKVAIGADARGWEQAPMDSPERKLPSWTVSQVGLVPEASNTLSGNPAVMLAMHAPHFLEIAAATGDTLLHDFARSAVIGRYRNYPGYDINVDFTGVYARADYPLRSLPELSYNNIYYNHVWPHIALLYDYLVTDTETRSKGMIAFPSRYSNGYAYLKTRVYGDRTGVFMGEKDVRLWMPRALVTSSDPQLNYVAGHGNRSVYAAFTNQAPHAGRAEIAFSQDQLLLEPGRSYRVDIWQDGKKLAPAMLVDGKVSIPVSPRGLTAIAVRGVEVYTRFQPEFLDPATAALGDKSYRADETPLGKVTGMLLTLGRGHRSGYVWLAASEAQAKAAKLEVTLDGKPRTFTDTSYPFEFDFPVADAQAEVNYTVEITRMDGTTVKTGPLVLAR
ncbi:hypothetical protein P6144_11285 [Sphingomonas sp. HITSZ_GF]|uniref:hypothetical protein n=1 Tax=Sphingomonas sp. HITSZ_GF TaxID=3037247 RepID=UPI00240DC049|nr:hypothetical protein [Sphingomonas sp. HITSZ_GF]MDG2534235.1 hypothetical protein [Sphingomonas sp. HITSZ_GF]